MDRERKGKGRTGRRRDCRANECVGRAGAYPMGQARHAGPSDRGAVSHAHGTPVRVPARRRDRGAAAGLRAPRKGGAACLEGHIGRRTGIRIRHGPMRGILEDCEAEKAKDIHKRPWVRRECGHSNMMRHTDIVLSA